MADQQARREGFHDPIYCPRGRDDCKSLAQIISTGHVSFVCCGENNGEQISVATDRYRFCHKTAEGVDVLMNHDQRDMSHIAAVYGWALAAVIAPDAGSAIDGVAPTPNPWPNRCEHCGAGDDAHHSYTCPTGLHPDRRDTSGGVPGLDGGQPK